MNKVSPDIYDERYIHQFQTEAIPKYKQESSVFSSDKTVQKKDPPSHKLQDHAYEIQNPFELKVDNP